MNKFFILLLIYISLLSFTTALDSIGPFKQGSCVNVVHLCSNCTYSNITSVDYQANGTAAISGNFNMSNNLGEFNLYSCNITINPGRYIVNGFDNLGSWAEEYQVTVTGDSGSTAQAILYFLISIVGFILFICCLTLGIFLPSKNKKDEMTGYILAVENIKYLKILSWAFAYIFLFLIVYFGWMISLIYLSLPFLTGLFQFTFWGLVIAALPLFIVGAYLVISNLVRDSQVGDMLVRGLRIR